MIPHKQEQIVKQESQQIVPLGQSQIGQIQLYEGHGTVTTVGNYALAITEDEEGELNLDKSEMNKLIMLRIYQDVNLFTQWVSSTLEVMTKEEGLAFKEELMLYASFFPESAQKLLMEEINEIYRGLEARELFDYLVKEELPKIKIESMPKAIAEGEFSWPKDAPEWQVNLPSEHLKASVQHILMSVPMPLFHEHYEGRQQMLVKQEETLPQKHMALRMFIAAYQYTPLSEEGRHRVQMFLMKHYYRLYARILPHYILHSKKLCQDLEAGEEKAIIFKKAMTWLLNFSGGHIFIERGGLGEAAYRVEEKDLAILYADDIALRWLYEKYSVAHPEIKMMFQKMYKWTKDIDEKITRNTLIKKRKDKIKTVYQNYYLTNTEEEKKPRSFFKPSKDNI